MKMRYTLLFTVVNAILLFTRITNINALDAQPIRGRLLTADEGCGYSKVLSSKIVGGAPARPGAYPWMALLGAVNSKGLVNFICGGSLITSRHILTAAHCILPDLSFVRLGEHDKTTTADGPHQDFKVINVDIHPYYTDIENGDGTGDIAILTLERDVDFNDRIRPICLPVQHTIQSMSLVLQNPFVAGWGLTQYGGTQPSNVLKEIQVSVLTNTVCEAAYRVHLQNSTYKLKRTQFTDSIICAGNAMGGPGTNSGDSGGPLMLPIFENGKFPMYQIGVVSWAINQPKPFTPGCYARVSFFMGWIQRVLSQQ